MFAGIKNCYFCASEAAVVIGMCVVFDQHPVYGDKALDESQILQDTQCTWYILAYSYAALPCGVPGNHFVPKTAVCHVPTFQYY